MIKLKDILSESTNIDLHKIITAKDTPSFMTEEEWAGKWSTIKEASNIDETILGELAESTAINEALLEGPDHELFKNRVYQGVMRKAILKFVMTLTPNSRPTKILQKYFETGKISPREVSQIMFQWGKYVKATATGATAILYGLLYKMGIFKGAHVLAMPIFQSIIRFALHMGMTAILPNSIAGQNFYNKRLSQAGKYLEKKKSDSDKEKKSIDFLNKRIKQINSKPGLFK